MRVFLKILNHNIFTGEEIETTHIEQLTALPLARVFKGFPVALLAPSEQLA